MRESIASGLEGIGAGIAILGHILSVLTGLGLTAVAVIAILNGEVGIAVAILLLALPAGVMMVNTAIGLLGYSVAWVGDQIRPKDDIFTF